MTVAPWHDARRILVIVPHPDDEAAGCCAALARARAAGAELHGAVLTTGIPAAEVLWRWSRKGHAARVERRRAEAAAAAAELAIDMHFGTLPTRRVREALLETYAWLEALCTARRIDTLWTPAYEGGHADHDCANALACELASRLALRVFEFAEYNNARGLARSHVFPQRVGTEYDLTLDAGEARFKRRVLAHYRSARRDLGYIGVERECFRPLADYDYSLPPHPGTLFYERFHWVYLRHPAIDFTTGAEVAADLVRFRARLAARAMRSTALRAGS